MSFRDYGDDSPGPKASPRKANQVTSPIPTDLVERVARALADKRNELIGLPPAWWSDGSKWNGADLVLTPNERDRYREEARAAIEATGVEHLQSQITSARELLERWDATAHSQRWRDKTDLSISAHPVAEDTRNYLAALKTMEQGDE